MKSWPILILVCVLVTTIGGQGILNRYLLKRLADIDTRLRQAETFMGLNYKPKFIPPTAPVFPPIEERWAYSSTTDKGRKLHACLIPYRELSEVDKQSDRDFVIGIPLILKRAGLRIEPLRDERGDLR